jgi:MOSC domain-containing protein YiiM
MMPENPERATAVGRVVGLQRSGGGVPKRAVDRAVVTVGGMDGDRQRNRRFHGGPTRALCLYSQECIDALVAEGHPIAPGTLGENVTVAGLPWSDVRPGIRLRIGAVEAEVTAYAAPCDTIAHAFADGKFTRIGQKPNPGWSRVYVSILHPGPIAVGDQVQILSATAYQ